MLSRTAEHLYWMARYIERAETTARLLEVGARNALLPNATGGYRNDWEAVLLAKGTLEPFVEKYTDINQRNIETWLFFDSDNPSSVYSCLSAARENARVVRTALTAPVWDAINGAFQELQQLHRTERSKLMVTDLCEWTLRACQLIRGAFTSTQLRNDGYDFSGIGTTIERADNTARLIDVKYYVLLPSVNYVGSGLDQSQWALLLQSMTAQRAFNWSYQGEVTAAKIAHLLILNHRFPRSLRACVQWYCEHLDNLAESYQTATAAQEVAHKLLDDLRAATVEEIFEEGLHEFLARFMSRNAEVATTVQEVYLSGMPA
ncbi:alpha-E domain-containing protein [Yangia mangrovi]|uniref:Alpha-E domain-containing protein n=1 Tax=Alloyangia mangrovi TaxID=1779329 RepID=A0A2A3JVI6_9RHOB|nr:alpha-E domain-containing protein [Alloyangia mangrovi]MCA0940123.1 alpha-E domain-containing protein [Alloyangia pacifica]MCA0945710.1 alpha-E domain-containing protein [Alloyangia pacifica]MCT4370452.1 alpha-E domain-containing protein [Alloyangia mangrovi]